MLWSRRYEMVGEKGEQKRLLAYFSACTRYAILRVKDRVYRLNESDGFGGGYYVAFNEFPTLAAAKEKAEQEEAVRLKIWHYFEVRGQREYDDTQRLLTDDKAMGAACGLVQDSAKRKADWTAEHHASYSYAYHKYRAHRRNGSGTLKGQHTDPAAWREWQEMLDGTYKQWWERQRRAS